MKQYMPSEYLDDLKKQLLVNPAPDAVNRIVSQATAKRLERVAARKLINEAIKARKAATKST